MNVSLLQFLRTGCLGALRPGMSYEQVYAFLGSPDGIGNMSRKYRHPNVYVFGTVEVSFSRHPPYEMTSLFWEAGVKGKFHLPPGCEIEDWAFTPRMTLAEIQAFLLDNALSFAYSDTLSTAMVKVIVLENGIQITVYKDTGLYSVYAGTP